MGEVRFGEIDAGHGRAALQWIECACALARDGEVEGLVTGPINKEAARPAA
jgi:4-phospho-D-threonate 3-dehydrogenase / 4-phospho-D-erythronate 3-dehydrogenase